MPFRNIQRALARLIEQLDHNKELCSKIEDGTAWVDATIGDGVEVFKVVLINDKRLPPDPRAVIDRTVVPASAASYTMQPASVNPNNKGLLGLPNELKIAICNLLLVKDKPIVGANKLLGRRKSVSYRESPAIAGIDGVILRSCREFNQLGLSTLYGGNTFHFGSVEDIKEFAFTGLKEIPCMFNFRRATSGRLSMVCNAYVELGARTLFGRESSQKELYESWSTYLSGDATLSGFPALRNLTLDFTEWRLDGDDSSKFRIYMFARMFCGTERLQKLSIKGVASITMLDELRKGLVKDGGCLEVIEDRL